MKTAFRWCMTSRTSATTVFIFTDMTAMLSMAVMSGIVSFSQREPTASRSSPCARKVRSS